MVIFPELLLCNRCSILLCNFTWTFHVYSHKIMKCFQGKWGHPFTSSYVRMRGIKVQTWKWLQTQHIRVTYCFDLCSTTTSSQTFKIKFGHLISPLQPSLHVGSHNSLSKATISTECLELIELPDKLIQQQRTWCVTVATWTCQPSHLWPKKADCANFTERSYCLAPSFWHWRSCPQTYW